MSTIGQMIVVQDEDTDEIFWQGGFIDDKQESNWSVDEPLTLIAKNFPIGTIVDVSAPDDE